MEKLNVRDGFEINNSVFNNVGSGSGGYGEGVSADDGEEKSCDGVARPRHRYSYSVDSSSLVFSKVGCVMPVVLVLVVGIC